MDDQVGHGARGDLTALLEAARVGGENTKDRLVRAVYGELRRMAAGFMRPALRTVLDYLWEDEEEGYRDDPDPDHIFLESGWAMTSTGGEASTGRTS